MLLDLRESIRYPNQAFTFVSLVTISSYLDSRFRIVTHNFGDTFNQLKQRPIFCTLPNKGREFRDLHENRRWL